MKVTVKLIGGFVHTVGFSEQDLELAPGSTVDHLLAAIKISRERPMIVSRDGWVLRPEDALREGDRVVIAPVFSGG